MCMYLANDLADGREKNQSVLIMCNTFAIDDPTRTDPYRPSEEKSVDRTTLERVKRRAALMGFGFG